MTEQKSLALVPASISEAEAMASTLSKSSMLPEHFKGKVSDVFWAIGFGLEVGFGPVAALSSVYVVHGKPGLYADAMVALVLASGKARFFTRVSSDDKHATYETHRHGDPQPVQLTVTMDYAERAGWPGTNPKYKSEPQRMLEARCKSWLARDKYPDVLRGIAAVEELRDDAETGPAPAPAFRPPTNVIDVPSTEAGAVASVVDVDALVAELAAAPTLAALTALGSSAKGRTGKERDRLLTAYKQRLAELTAAAGAA